MTEKACQFLLMKIDCLCLTLAQNVISIIKINSEVKCRYMIFVINSLLIISSALPSDHHKLW